MYLYVAAVCSLDLDVNLRMRQDVRLFRTQMQEMEAA